MTDPQHISTIGLTLFAAMLVVVTPVQTESQRLSPEDRAAIEAGPVYTPFTVSPEIRNRYEIQTALVREYPAALRDSGIGGRAVLWFYISDLGQVLHSQIYESSGYEELDQAALKVSDAFEFFPAIHPREVPPGDIPNAVIRTRDVPVPVWIQLPITFAVG